MLDSVAALPFWQAFAALWLIVMARSNATYWIGRGAIAGWRRHRLAPASASRARAEALIRRLGPAGVTLSYLTIGIQTAVHLSAGLLRMPLRYYLPAAVIGSVAWAVIYATIGMAFIEAWIAAAAGSWFAAAALLVLGIGLTTWLLSRRRDHLALEASREVPSETSDEVSSRGRRKGHFLGHRRDHREVDSA